MASLTTINSSYAITVPGLFGAPVILGGYDVDDAFTSEAVDRAEVKVGVDNRKSQGLIAFLFTQSITLQADSPSNAIFDAIVDAERALMDTLSIVGTIVIPALRVRYTLNNGTLKNSMLMPDAKKILQPRKYTIIYEQPIRMPF